MLFISTLLVWEEVLSLSRASSLLNVVVVDKPWIKCITSSCLKICWWLRWALGEQGGSRMVDVPILTCLPSHSCPKVPFQEEDSSLLYNVTSLLERSLIGELKISSWIKDTLGEVQVWLISISSLGGLLFDIFIKALIQSKIFMSFLKNIII